MTQNMIKILIKALAILLGTFAALLTAFILCMATISLSTPHDYLFMLGFILGLLLPVYTLSVAFYVIKDYSNKSVGNLCVLLCVLLFFIIEHFFRPLAKNSNPPSMPELACSLLVTFGIPYLAYRLLNYLNYKFINPKLAIPVSTSSDGRP